MCAHSHVAVDSRLFAVRSIERQPCGIATRQPVTARIHLQFIGSRSDSRRNHAAQRAKLQKPQPFDAARSSQQQQRLTLRTVQQQHLLPRSSECQATGARHHVLHRIVHNHRAFVQSSQLIIEQRRRRKRSARPFPRNQPRHRQTGQTAQQKQRQRFHRFLLWGRSDHADHVAFAPTHCSLDGLTRLHVGILGADLSP